MQMPQMLCKFTLKLQLKVMINYKQQCCKNSYKSTKEQKDMEKEKQANQVPCLAIIYIFTWQVQKVHHNENLNTFQRNTL
jgi:hypothetical protein